MNDKNNYNNNLNFLAYVYTTQEKSSFLFLYACKGLMWYLLHLTVLKDCFFFIMKAKLTQSAQVVIEREYNNSDNSAK